MSFQRKLKYFLVHQLNISNKEAQQKIEAGEVLIDGEKTLENCIVSNLNHIALGELVLQEPRKLRYLAFYKPSGYESTLNRSIPDNLSDFFEKPEQLAIAGRLDKNSEGLLLLSNDGKWIEQICNPKTEKEKEYIVRLENEPTDADLLSFSNGLKFAHRQISKSCSCVKQSSLEVRIILTEGKNRQIRKMWFTLGNYVVELKRIRIDKWHLGNLSPGEQFEFQPYS